MFAYCGNNPVSRSDSGGEWWHLAVGAVLGGIAGAISNVASQVMEQMSQGVSLADVNIDLVNVACSTAAGMATGVLAASGAGIVSQVAGNAFASATSNTLIQCNNIANGRQESWSWSSFSADVVTGAIAGIVGGRGASYGNAKGIYQSGVQATKRILNNVDEFGKAISYYAKTAHQTGGAFVMDELGKAIGKGFVVAIGSAAIQNSLR